MPCCQGQDVFENVGRRGAGQVVWTMMMALIDKRRHEEYIVPLLEKTHPFYPSSFYFKLSHVPSRCKPSINWSTFEQLTNNQQCHRRHKRPLRRCPPPILPIFHPTTKKGYPNPSNAAPPLRCDHLAVPPPPNINLLPPHHQLPQRPLRTPVTACWSTPLPASVVAWLGKLSSTQQIPSRSNYKPRRRPALRLRDPWIVSNRPSNKGGSVACTLVCQCHCWGVWRKWACCSQPWVELNI